MSATQIFFSLCRGALLLAEVRFYDNGRCICAPVAIGHRVGKCSKVGLIDIEIEHDAISDDCRRGCPGRLGHTNDRQGITINVAIIVQDVQVFVGELRTAALIKKVIVIHGIWWRIRTVIIVYCADALRV